jgi:hypothetical protein
MSRRLGAALAALVLAACYTIRYERRSALPEPGTPREVTHHAFVGGIVPGQGPVHLQPMCPAGIASVESRVSGSDWFWQALTSLPFAALPALLWTPIWEPTQASVTCARPATARAVGKPVKVALLPLTPLGGVPKETTQLMGDALAGELRRRPGVSVLTQADLTALLGVERSRQMLGCTDSGCMAELGGALGADRVIHGSIGRVGGSLVVNLSALDPRKARTTASATERLRDAGDEALLDVLPALADALLAEPAVPGASGGGPR